MTDTDFATIVNSTNVQAVLRPTTQTGALSASPLHQAIDLMPLENAQASTRC